MSDRAGRAGVIGIALLGSTGSIGRQTLEVVAAHPDRFAVRALAAGHLDERLRGQLLSVPQARVWTRSGGPGDQAQRWAAGGLEELATLDGVDLVVIATTGMAALPAALAALRSGRNVALANKETLVTGGHLVARELDERGDRLGALRPVDSEHSAIWQCLRGEEASDVRRLILTASGGPFREFRDVSGVTPEQALAHPTWRMGAKITIDSATLVNKAFETIEAKWLYEVPYSKIAAVIHPQSVVHSLVEFRDGSFKAQLGLPDMRLPIQYALTYPQRLPSPARQASPDAWGALDFAPLERGRYPAFDVVLDAARAGGNRGTVLNAADEVAVEAFLAGAIAFPRIATIIERAVGRWGADLEPELDEIVALDAEVRAALTLEMRNGSPA
jgi:1-deoxy-D-xylulose-5-phosphate reductoisomerase